MEGGEGKQVCKYGRACYRKNPQHFQEFDHPWQDEDEGEPPAVKRPKLDNSASSCSTSATGLPSLSSSSSSLPSTSPSSVPRPLFYLTKVRGIDSSFNTPSTAIGIRDILSPSMGDLVSSAQFNYMIDIPWLIQQYPKEKRKCPLLVVHGEQRESLLRLRKEAEPYPNMKLFQAKLEIMFGTHHSKMMLLAYREGLRVVIHTANLIHKDWDQKTQGVWVSPVFPPKSSSGEKESSETAAAKETDFQKDLLEYLAAYGGGALDEWRRRIRDHDLSSARVRLIASVPGGHTGDRMNKWGHLKLRRVLSAHCALPDGVGADEWPVIGQFSSVGSLGPSPSQWLMSEWLLSLSSTRKSSRLPSALHKYPALQLVFPSVENVRTSLEGYMAGGSIPYASQTAAKQPYLKNYLCQWKADGTGRSQAAPHIKTYTRVSPDYKQLSWLLITSANLSKAAWGALEKRGSQLKIRSYEIGVLFLPSDQDPSGSEQTFTAATLASPSEEGASSGVRLRTPFDLPPTPYSSKDEPWLWNARHMQPDSKGNVWTPS